MSKDKKASDRGIQDLVIRPEVERRGSVKEATFAFNLGDEVRDTVTGFEGVVVGREDCITGCDRMHVQPKSKDGKDMPSGYMVDQDRLVLLFEIAAPPFEVVKAGAPATPRLMESR